MKKRFWFYLIFGGLALFLLGRLYYQATDDFRTSNIVYQIPHNPDWEIPPLQRGEQADLDRILSQQFQYLGKGAQSYAFLSEDGQYVLKLIKFKHIKPSLIVKSLPSIGPFKHYKKKHLERKNKMLTGVFSGYHLAYRKHREESGIIYIHLNRTDTIGKTVVLYDKIGIRRKIDLDNVVFVLQQRAVKTREALRQALNDKDVALAKKRMRAVFDLYALEYEKGMYDRDRGVMHNTGFIGDRVIRLDVGKLVESETIKEPAARKEDFDKVLARMRRWLRANYPDLYPELAVEMDAALQRVSTNSFED